MTKIIKMSGQQMGKSELMRQIENDIIRKNPKANFARFKNGTATIEKFIGSNKDKNITDFPEPRDIFSEKSKCTDFDSDCDEKMDATACWLYDPEKGYCPLLNNCEFEKDL